MREEDSWAVTQTLST